jgi:glycogen debranching enzyme
MVHLLSAYDGASFIVLEPGGDILEGREGGLYHEDTRFLSLFTLRLGGAAPLVLTSRSPAAHLAVVFAINPALPGIAAGALVIRRAFAVGGGLHGDVDITSYAVEAVEVDLDLEFDTDFADVFTVKRAVESAPSSATSPACSLALGRAVLALTLDSSVGWSRRTEVRFSERPVFEGRRARFHLALPPGGAFHVCLDVYTIAEGNFIPPRHRCSQAPGGVSEGAWIASNVPRPPPHPGLRSSDPTLDQAFNRAIEDLYALRIARPESARDDFYLAAGVPWFMALFGRDSLLASLQASVFLPDLARGVLRSLARWQGKKDDPETEEQPGKILHELRPEGLVGARSFTPRFPYFGSVDATPLFVMLLAEHHRRTGDLAFLRAMERSLVAAVGWIEGPADRDGDGFLEYQRSTSFGLENQGWKDSGDAIRFRDGRLAEAPIALVEVQGYAACALLGAASLYRALGRDEASARALEARAAALVAAIDRAYWMEDRGLWAMALDARKQRVDALASNGAHLLFCGATPPERAARAAQVLTSRELFSGFGLRTLGASEGGYSPIAYHNGSVWPHDTSIAAAGLARYGRLDEARLLTGALLDAASFYDQRRLPELFAGLPREDTPFPVEYPTSNSPQAWAAGAILLLVTTMLGLTIDVPARLLRVRPALPARVDWLRLTDLAVAGASLTIEVRTLDGHAVTSVEGAPEGYRVETETETEETEGEGASS